MAHSIGIFGDPSTGKTTCLFENQTLGIKGLPKDSNFYYLTFTNKIIPYRPLYSELKFSKEITDITKGSRALVVKTSAQVINALKYISEKTKSQIVVIDDAGYSMSLDVLREADVKSYDKWNIYAKNMFSILDPSFISSLREDLTVISIFHAEGVEKKKIKTSGQLLDKTIQIDGLFDTLLYASSEYDFSTEQTNRFFITNGQGTYGRSLAGMFEDKEPMDIGVILEKYKAYFV